jgi:hypothetical protein
VHLPLAVDVHGRKLSKSSDAPPIALADPRATLAAALVFLGQPVPGAPDAAAMLQAAARGFDLSPLRGVAVRKGTAPPVGSFVELKARPSRRLAAGVSAAY